MKLLFCSHRNFVRFYPQVQWTNSTKLSPQSTGGTAFLPEMKIENHLDDDNLSDIADLRNRLDFRFWSALTQNDWTKWESVANLYQSHNLPMDEVSFTILLHGYLMSHHHPSSVALLVLESMKSPEHHIHPAIVGLNENLVHSFFELSDIGIKSSLNGWQNFVRLAWMAAARLRNKRTKRLKETLDSLSTKEVLALTEKDAFELLKEEHAVAQVLCDLQYNKSLRAQHSKSIKETNKGNSSIPITVD